MSPASAEPTTRPPRRPPRRTLGGASLPFAAAPGRPSPRCSDLPPRHPGCSPALPTSLGGASACDMHPSASRNSAAGRRRGGHSLAAGRVHQQRDEGGRGRADAVQGQHGVLALLLTHHVVCGRDGQGLPPPADTPRCRICVADSCSPVPADAQLGHTHRGAHQVRLPFSCPRLLPSLTPGAPEAGPAWGPCLHLPSEKMECQLSPAVVLRAPEPAVLQPPTPALGGAHDPPVCEPANFT